MGQWAPRIGFAYRLGDRTVLRGGYGMFYEAEGTSGRLNFHFLPFSMSETVNATTNVVPNRTTADYFLGVPFGASVGKRWLESADARRRLRLRPAMELRRSARDLRAG